MPYGKHAARAHSLHICPSIPKSVPHHHKKDGHKDSCLCLRITICVDFDLVISALKEFGG